MTKVGINGLVLVLKLLLGIVPGIELGPTAPGSYFLVAYEPGHASAGAWLLMAAVLTGSNKCFWLMIYGALAGAPLP